ncbi:MAG TPA: sensor histidine kinase, partial [Thiolinea sp.]|nr:sensor histidine kinase [Thiolinea sp.]
MLINARLPLPRGVRFSLRTILLIVMLTIITLPLLGLYFFRIYENELVRQTELELIAQSAVLSATWRQQLRGLNPDSSHYGYIINTSPFLPGQNRGYLEDTDPFLTPIQPTLDLVKPMHGPRP